MIIRAGQKLTLQYSVGGHVVIYKFVGNNSGIAVNNEGIHDKIPFPDLDDAIRFVNLDLVESRRNSVI